MKSLKRIAALIMTATAMITVNSCDTVGPETEGQKDESVVINISSITQTENSATLSGMVKMGKDVPAGTAIAYYNILFSTGLQLLFETFNQDNVFTRKKRISRAIE